MVFIENSDQNFFYSCKKIHGSSVTVIHYPDAGNPGHSREQKYFLWNHWHRKEYLKVDDNVQIGKKNISSRIQTSCYDEGLE